MFKLYIRLIDDMHFLHILCKYSENYLIKKALLAFFYQKFQKILFTMYL